MTTEVPDIEWLPEVAAGNFDAALSYLTLIYDPVHAKKFVQSLKKANISKFKAKDISRASGLSLLGISNTHVQRDIEKVQAGKALSPILLVRDTVNGKVIVADGYHRMCAIYQLHEDAFIRCCIV